MLIRHAKSSWADPGQQDFDRPLNDRGKNDAPMMAKRVKDRKINIDLLISSSAKRARKTAQFFAEEFDQDKHKVELRDELYLAPPERFYELISKLDDQLSSVAIFAHNPGITEFANELTSVRVDDMPTCAVYALTVHTDQWKNFRKADKQFLFFDYPKNL